MMKEVGNSGLKDPGGPSLWEGGGEQYPLIR